MCQLHKEKCLRTVIKKRLPKMSDLQLSMKKDNSLNMILEILKLPAIKIQTRLFKVLILMRTLLNPIIINSGSRICIIRGSNR